MEMETISGLVFVSQGAPSAVHVIYLQSMRKMTRNGEPMVFEREQGPPVGDNAIYTLCTGVVQVSGGVKVVRDHTSL